MHFLFVYNLLLISFMFYIFYVARHFMYHHDPEENLFHFTVYRHDNKGVLTWLE